MEIFLLIFSYQKILFLFFLIKQFQSVSIEITNQYNFSRGIMLDNGNILITTNEKFFTYDPKTNENITQKSITPLSEQIMEKLSFSKIKNGKVIVLVNNIMYIFNNDGSYITSYTPLNSIYYFDSNYTYSILPFPEINSNVFIISFTYYNNGNGYIYHYYFSDTQSTNIIYNRVNVIVTGDYFLQGMGNIECIDIDTINFICCFIYYTYPRQLTCNYFLYSNLERITNNYPSIIVDSGQYVHIDKNENNYIIICYNTYNTETYCANFIYSEIKFNNHIKIHNKEINRIYSFNFKYLGNEKFILASLVGSNIFYYIMDKNLNLYGEEYTFSTNVNEVYGYTSIFSILYYNKELRFLFNFNNLGAYLSDKINICYCNDIIIKSKKSNHEKKVFINFIDYYIGICIKIKISDLSNIENKGEIYYIKDGEEKIYQSTNEIKFLEDEVFFLSNFQFDEEIEINYSIFYTGLSSINRPICKIKFIQEILEEEEEETKNEEEEEKKEEEETKKEEEETKKEEEEEKKEEEKKKDDDIIIINTNETVDEYVKHLNDSIKHIDLNKTTIIEGNGFNGQINIIENGSPSKNIIKHTNKTYSKIDFSECEKVLRDYYKIYLPEKITFVELDIDRVKINERTEQIEYLCYNSKGNLLNLSLCKDTKIYVTYQIKNITDINLTLASYFLDKGIDIFNPDDPFFNDICYPFSTEDGKDIILEDRRNEIYQNISLCEENCVYDSISIENLTVTCKCNVKEIVKTKITPNFFLQAFESIFINSNFSVVKCYKLVFRFTGKFLNIGFWVFLIFTSLHFPFHIWYFVQKLYPLQKYIILTYFYKKLNPPKRKNENGYYEKEEKKIKKKEIKYNDFFNKMFYKNYNNNDYSISEFEDDNKKKGKREYYLNKRSKINSIESENNLMNDKSKNDIKFNLKKKESDEENQDDFLDDYTIENNIINEKIKNNNYSIKNKKFSINASQSTIYSNSNINKYANDIYRNEKIKKSNLIIKDDDQIKGNNKFENLKNNSKSKYSNKKNPIYLSRIHRNINSKGDNLINTTTNYELNEKEIIGKIPSNDYLNDFNFEEALIFDNRKFWKIYYLNLLTKQNILSTFVFKSPFELMYIRIIMYIFGISMDFAFNAFFYFQSAISHRYHYQGKLGYLFDLQNSFYINIISCIASFFLAYFLGLFGNSKNNFEAIFKNNDNKKKENNNYDNNEIDNTENEKDKKKENDINKNKKKQKHDIIIKYNKNIIQNEKMEEKVNEKEKVLENKFKEYQKILKCLKKKLIFFIIIELLFMLFFWYYVTAFCEVYKSSQKSWATGGLTSFIISLFTPLIVALLLTFLRLFSMKNKFKCLFNLSVWLYDF